MNFVLVHGGWHGGWCWRPVAQRLRAHGHAVWTPTLTGSGERAHLLHPGITVDTGIEDILGVLAAEELSDVVLVGHSSGGLIVSGVADRAPGQLRSLLFLDAVLAHDGESLRTSFTPPQEAAYQAALLAGAASFPSPPASFFHVPDGPSADWVNRRLTPLPFGVAASPLRLQHPVGAGLRCAYIACNTPVHPFVAAAHTWAQTQQHWQWRELPAGHDAMITDPEAVASLLEQLA